MTVRGREALWRFAEIIGMHYGLRRLNARRLLALSYHGVVPDDRTGDGLVHPDWLSTTEFTQQLEELALYYRPIGISDLIEWRLGRSEHAKPPVLITFDDGYRNNFRYALPILTRMGIPALFNICTGYIGTDRMLWGDELRSHVLSWPTPSIPLPGSDKDAPLASGHAARFAMAERIIQHCKQISDAGLRRYLDVLRRGQPAASGELDAFMSWDEVRRVRERAFDIGSHSVDHPVLSRVQESDLRRQIVDSKREIETRLQMQCQCFAYPNGGWADVSAPVFEAVRSAGYTFGFMVTGGLSAMTDDPIVVDRIYVPMRVSWAEFRARTSGLHYLVKHFINPRKTSHGSPLRAVSKAAGSACACLIRTHTDAIGTGNPYLPS